MTEEKTLIGNIITILRGFNFLQKNDVVDNLTTSTTNVPLSAKQGKELKTLVDAKQDTLVSGTNLKTVNNTSLLGNGDITINSGGGSYITDYYWDTTNKEIVLDYSTSGSPSSSDIVISWSSTLSDEKVASEKLVKNSLDSKADSNHNHTGTYASSSHNHNLDDLNNTTTVTVTVTYTDNSTETINLIKYTGN